MVQTDNKLTAQNLMATHGLRAQAVVHERMDEARLQGDASALAQWRDVQLAIGELRRTGAAVPGDLRAR